MLEIYNNDSITIIEDLKDFITVIFVIVDDIYQEVTPTYIKNRRNSNHSIMTDSEIITVSLAGKLMSIDSENAWVGYCKKNLKELFPSFCSRTRFNRTRKSLYKIIELIRHNLTKLVRCNYDFFRIVDSMPIYACKFGRARFHKTYRSYAAYGKCASKKETFYGFKLHSLITFDGYITDFTLTSANIDDREALWDLTNNINCITVLGDKGYIGDDICSDLSKERNINLISMKRNNSKSQLPKQLRQQIFKRRRLIETVNSQLSEQLNIARVLAKSRLGLLARLETKILAHNICCFINKVLRKSADILKIKQLIFG
ncbi:IS982 family transposase [Clostridium sp. WLY-B-L2]|uniref:IS982 family transposase n=1 Tax=Clostridium aromativorans TaxID=2836848 RepID=A0ABS8N824_9CLOT|nr:IS982 family transposase [Clostridium aromativorans]MCC9295961.1 IS982 family transposase [Clostridium aromativorans]